MSGHPCTEDCCDAPRVTGQDHECDESEHICEACYVLECQNCGATCGCEL